MRSLPSILSLALVAHRRRRGCRNRQSGPRRHPGVLRRHGETGRSRLHWLLCRTRPRLLDGGPHRRQAGYPVLHLLSYARSDGGRPDARRQADRADGSLQRRRIASPIPPRWRNGSGATATACSAATARRPRRAMSSPISRENEEDHETARIAAMPRHRPPRSRRACRRGAIVPPIEHAATLKECGACHLAFPPQMLPARSWKKLMGDLANHFGRAPACRRRLARRSRRTSRQMPAMPPIAKNGRRFLRESTPRRRRYASRRHRSGKASMRRFQPLFHQRQR